VNTSPALIAGVVGDFVANVVRHYAAAFGMVVDQVVENAIMLARNVIGENPVGAVVVNHIVTNYILTGTKRGTSCVDLEASGETFRVVLRLAQSCQ
jgi:hypothetical protein